MEFYGMLIDNIWGEWDMNGYDGICYNGIFWD